MHGYHDRLAWIDLTDRRVDFRTLDPRDVERFVGGGNLGAALLARQVGPQTDPLGPDNPLIFMTGPFTATRVPSGSRHELISLAPLTGIYGESNSGGSFGWHLKRLGYDGLVITGASNEPVSIALDQDRITFQNAANLWGLDVYAADEKIKSEFNPDVVTAIIGPAGERMVRLANVVHNGRHARSAGRCGLGAVMGSKKLKAVIVNAKGAVSAPLADPEGLKASIRATLPMMKERLELFGKIGTPGGVINYERLGNLPIKNWRLAKATELASKITGTVLKEQIQVKRSGCKGCPIVCGRLVEVKNGFFATQGLTEGPEYEALASFGSLCLNDNLEAIAKANEQANRLGLDCISTGGVIAFAFECAEKGLISRDEADGLELGFGRAEAIVELVRRIALKEGDLARILGQGVRRASQTIGRNSEEYALHVKGLEFPMHDPRFSWGHAVSYATGNRGACHLSSLAHPFEIGVALPELGYAEPHPGRQQEGKAQWTIHLQNLMNVLDSLIVCKFAVLNNALTTTNFREWYNLITGRGVDLDEFMAIGERGFTLKRMINNRRGVSRKDDVLPPRMRTQKKQGPDVEFDVPPLEPMLREYYDLRDWSEEGRPSPETIARLNLTDLV